MIYDAYDCMYGIRRSDLWHIRKSPAHFRYHMDNPPEKTAALNFGIAMHKWLLEPETFSDEVAVWEGGDLRKKETKLRREAFDADCFERGIRCIITEAEFEQIQVMADVVNGDVKASALLDGIHERVISWVDPETGERCKCKPDCITEYEGQKWIVDYKTTTSCEPGAFERDCRRYGYQFQAGMYTEGVFQAEFEECRFAFIAQEKDAPYVLRVYTCDPEFVREGYDQFRELLGIYHFCKQSDYWPGYEEEVLLSNG